MTTSWAYATHGQLADALKTPRGRHAAGAVAAVVSLARDGLGRRGARTSLAASTRNVVVGVVVAATGLIVCEWIVRVLAG